MFRKDVINSCSVFICLMLFLITLSLFWKNNDKVDNYYPVVVQREQSMLSKSNSHVPYDVNLVIAQRNKLSKLLNKKQQIIGRMKCEELNRTKIAKEETTDAGGWCPKASKTKHLGFDKSLAAGLALFFQGKNVASFGDGPGRFKEAVKDTGLVKVYDAFDGAPFCEETSEGRVQFLDLSLPQYGLPVYDWILCLEVAEHVPKAFEDILLNNIVRHAREGVILSWARPGQNGYSHINNQPPEYVISAMSRLGFKLDMKFTNEVRGKTSNKNLKKNINVFVRQQMKSVDELLYNA